MTTTPFSYSLISQDFIAGLNDVTLTGGSVVLLGPRYIGKRYVIHHLRRLWAAQAVSPTVALQFMSETPICTTRQLEDEVSRAVARVAPDLVTPERTYADPLDPIKRLAEREGKPVYLTAANIDGMAHHLARTFLGSMRNLVEAGPKPMVHVVMSGEADFHELVYGPNSDFTCAREQHVLQGFTEAEFKSCLRRYLSSMRLHFADEEETAAHLFELSGGNTYLLRIILWSILQMRTRENVHVEKAVPLKEIPDSSKLMNIPGAYGSHVFHRATQIIKGEPKCWRDLEALLKPETVTLPVPPGQITPSRLELAGVAVRVTDQDTGRQYLKVSSRLMHDFLMQYYNARRLGDLYAGIGDWDIAFDRYRRPRDEEERKRPAGADDREDVEATLAALTASLFRAAKKTPDEHSQLTDNVKGQFVGGCNYVLGFRQVTFWRRATWKNDSEWERDTKGYEPTPSELRRIRKILPTSLAPKQGYFELPEGENKLAAAAILPPQRQGELLLVIVSDFEPDVVISRERKELLKKLLEDFIEAYKHAVELDDLKTRLRARKEHVKIMNKIFKSLGEHNLSVRNVLEVAAGGLLSHHYRRVIFSLVDPERRYIEVILDESNPSQASTGLAGRFKWPLKPPTDHILPFIVSAKEKDHEIISDISRYSIQDKEFVEAAAIKTMALIKLLNHAHEAVGVLLVERVNGELPSASEVDDLRSFCNQLAIAIEQCERLSMLEAGINRIPEPLIIVDGTASPRYANQPAADLLGIEVGWRDRKQSEPLSAEKDGDIANIVRESMSLGFRHAGRVENVGGRPDYHGEVVADAIRDSLDKKRVVGGLIRIQDRNYLHKFFAASQLLAEANDRESAMQAMLNATKLLGHEWGRLYLIKSGGDDSHPVFVSRMSFGGDDPEVTRKFEEGQITLDRSNPHGSNDWLCIEKRQPVVFCWLDNVRDGEEYVTPSGLRAINWHAQYQPLGVRKKPGDFWIDFPLVTPKPAEESQAADPRYSVGKMCLQCDRSMRPEDFEMLKQLAESFSEILKTSHQRELNVEARERTIRVAVAQKIMATTAHNIGTRMMGLPILRAQYKAFEKKLPELSITNEKFTHTLQRVFTTIRRAQEMLAPDIRHFSCVDIVTEIERALSSGLTRSSWSLECTQRPIEMRVDTHLVENALLELVQNSRDHAASIASMKIAVTVEAIKTPEGDFVTVVYRDNGPGVPDELTERIFEDFFSRRPGRKTGTGLGLGFVRRVVEAHGGSIYYSPYDRPGAAFVIMLPRDGSADPAQEEQHVSHSNG